MTVDEKSESLYQRLVSGEISRGEFFDGYNNLYKEIEGADKRGLDRRLDNRTLGAFALMIYDSTRREKILIDLWRDMTLKIGLFSKFEIKNHGVDNSGKVFIKNTKAARGNADYIINVDGDSIPPGEYPLEVKFSPTLKKMTFKVADLSNYIKSNVLMLTILGDTKMLGPNGNPLLSPLTVDNVDATMLQWCLATGADMSKMLNTLEQKPYREMGFKECVQMKSDQFSQFFNLYGF